MSSWFRSSKNKKTTESQAGVGSSSGSYFGQYAASGVGYRASQSSTNRGGYGHSAFPEYESRPREVYVPGKNALEYTNEELEVMKLQNYPAYLDTMKERVVLEEEKMKQQLQAEEQKLEREYLAHKDALKVNQSQALQEHMSRRMDIEAQTEGRLAKLKMSAEAEKMKHETAMKESEQIRKRDMEDMQKRMLEQKKLQEQESAILDKKITAQKHAAEQRKKEQDESFEKLFSEQQQTFLDEEKELKVEIDNDLDEFDKLMEEQSAALDAELDDMFEREVIITKPDGTTLHMREKNPGIVTKIAEKLFDS